uniref:Secreted protein n=1 Tax=Rhipicephalus microplus TaxID=6941 RepID=A0A6M2D9P5_RHIMP
MDAVLIITLLCACFKRCAASFKSHHKQRAQPSLLQAIPQTGLPVEVCFFPLCSSQRKDTNKCAQIFPMFIRFQPRAHKRGLTDAFYAFFCLFAECLFLYVYPLCC